MIDVAQLNLWENVAPAPVAAADVLKADMIVEIGWVEMKFVFEESVTAAAATAPQNYVHEKVS